MSLLDAVGLTLWPHTLIAGTGVALLGRIVRWWQRPRATDGCTATVEPEPTREQVDRVIAMYEAELRGDLL